MCNQTRDSVVIHTRDHMKEEKPPTAGGKQPSPAVGGS